jgi:predicted DNA-binding transcriptional regulator AlpA
MADDRYVRTEQAAEFLGVAAATLKSWRLKAKGPPFFRPSNRVIRYRISVLDEWMKQHAVG